MKQVYDISGMTCKGCVASVKEKLLGIEDVDNVEVDLDKSEAEISMKRSIALEEFKAVLPEKYNINSHLPFGRFRVTNVNDKTEKVREKSKLQQLKPLLLIFLYLFSAAFLLNFKNWNISEAMLDFMGLFYVVFSFFKFLDLKSFPESFRMYDPFAKVLPIYGWVYPFIELILGLLFLMRFQIEIALITTIVILGITTVGVSKALLDKKSIRCACLGTALKLPMTEATFIENSIMLVMAVAMLFFRFGI